MTANLHKYQIDAVNFALTHPKCGLFLDLGLGKTLIALAVIETLYQHETGHILIIAPKAIARATWVGEIKKWGINIPYKSLIVNEKGNDLSRQKRLELYQEAVNNPVRTIYFINRDLIADLVENCPEVNKQKIWAYQTVIVDELQSFKSASSARFNALKAVSPAINRFIGLTGTPTPNGVDDIWSQIFLMDGGMRLGKNITTFRKWFMHPGYTNQQGIVCSWEPNPGAEAEIYRRISDTVISMKNTQLKLPTLSFVKQSVQMTQAQQKLYNQFLKTAVLEQGDMTATASNIAVLTTKLQQLASGTIYVVDENGAPTKDYIKIHEAKLERLKYIRENTDDNLLVAYYFQSDADVIQHYCADNNIPCEIFDSGKADEYLERWDRGEIPLLLIQPGSAGFGLNFQYASHTLIWYTLPFSLEEYLQTIGRLYRQGQKHTVYVHIIMTEKTIDEKIHQTLFEKQQSMQALLDAVEFQDPNAPATNRDFDAIIQKAKSVKFSFTEQVSLINSVLSSINAELR